MFLWALCHSWRPNNSNEGGPKRGRLNWATSKWRTSASSLVGRQTHKHGRACECRRQEQFCCRANKLHTGHGLRPTCRDDYHPGPENNTSEEHEHISTQSRSFDWLRTTEHSTSTRSVTMIFAVEWAVHGQHVHCSSPSSANSIPLSK